MRTLDSTLEALSEAWVLGEVSALLDAPFPAVDSLQHVENAPQMSGQCASLGCPTSLNSKCCTTYACGPAGSTYMCGC